MRGSYGIPARNLSPCLSRRDISHRCGVIIRLWIMGPGGDFSAICRIKGRRVKQPGYPLNADNGVVHLREGVEVMC